MHRDRHISLEWSDSSPNFLTARRKQRSSHLQHRHTLIAAVGANIRCGWTDQILDAGRALHMAELTLQKMGDGGIHDHIGGGFARLASPLQPSLDPTLLPVSKRCANSSPSHVTMLSPTSGLVVNTDTGAG